MHPTLRTRIRFLLLTTFVVAALGSTGFADTSLRLGATFPGWDKLDSFGVEGQLEEALVDLARGYGRQLGRVCTLPEAFLRENSSGLVTALVFYESYLPFDAREEVLLDSVDQRVSIVRVRFGNEVLVVLIDLDDLGVGMVVCAI